MPESQCSFQWNVQPYAKVSELANRYTQTIMSTTIYRAQSRATEAQAWMRSNAPWIDRTSIERRVARDYGQKFGERNARESLTVRANVNPNEVRKQEAARTKGIRADIKSLKTENINREARGLAPRAAVPRYRSAALEAGREIIRVNGPIVELKFEYKYDPAEYNVPYAVWLEIAHGGRWGIISKAINHWSPILVNDLKQLANLKQSGYTFSEETVGEEEIFQAYVAEENRVRDIFGQPTYEPFDPLRKAAGAPRHKRYLAGKRKERAEDRARAETAKRLLEEERAARKKKDEYQGPRIVDRPLTGKVFKRRK